MIRSVLIRHDDIDQTLASIPVAGKRALEPLKSLALRQGLPFKIVEDHQVPVSEAEVHIDEGDLWCCLEGSVRFVVGGELVRSRNRLFPDGSLNTRELVADDIENGTEYILKKGDWLWIPPGEPHIHTCVDTARLLIVKIPNANMSVKD